MKKKSRITMLLTMSLMLLPYQAMSVFAAEPITSQQQQNIEKGIQGIIEKNQVFFKTVNEYITASEAKEKIAGVNTTEGKLATELHNKKIQESNEKIKKSVKRFLENQGRMQSLYNQLPEGIKKENMKKVIDQAKLEVSQMEEGFAKAAQNPELKFQNVLDPKLPQRNQLSTPTQKLMESLVTKAEELGKKYEKLDKDFTEFGKESKKTPFMQDELHQKLNNLMNETMILDLERAKAFDAMEKDGMPAADLDKARVELKENSKAIEQSLEKLNEQAKVSLRPDQQLVLELKQNRLLELTNETGFSETTKKQYIRTFTELESIEKRADDINKLIEERKTVIDAAGNEPNDATKATRNQKVQMIETLIADHTREMELSKKKINQSIVKPEQNDYFEKDRNRVFDYQKGIVQDAKVGSVATDPKFQTLTLKEKPVGKVQTEIAKSVQSMHGRAEAMKYLQSNIQELAADPDSFNAKKNPNAYQNREQLKQVIERLNTLNEGGKIEAKALENMTLQGENGKNAAVIKELKAMRTSTIAQFNEAHAKTTQVYEAHSKVIKSAGISQPSTSGFTSKPVVIPGAAKTPAAKPTGGAVEVPAVVDPNKPAGAVVDAPDKAPNAPETPPVQEKAGWSKSAKIKAGVGVGLTVAGSTLLALGLTGHLSPKKETNAGYSTSADVVRLFNTEGATGEEVFIKAKEYRTLEEIKVPGTSNSITPEWIKSISPVYRDASGAEIDSASAKKKITITIFGEEGFGGKSAVITDKINSLKDVGFEGQVKSMKVTIAE